MIPEIGLMIGAYIITRMVVIAAPPQTNGAVAQVIATAFSMATILLTAIVMFDLFTREARGIPGL